MQRRLFLIILGLFLILLLYSFRGIYAQKFDYKYAKDLYDHSQWTLAKTVRSVSDDQVYQVAGYDAVTTGELYRVAPEVPPLGKYLVGTSIVIFKNAQIMSFILYIISIFVFYFLASLILKNIKLITIATLIFSTEPLIFSQATLSMMDLPLLISLLLHTLFMLLILKNNKETFPLFKKIILILGAGFSLGAFLAIKIGFFAIIIIMADLIILTKNKKLSSLLLIIIGAIVFYSFTYLPFFIQGHTFIEFLKAQKWMIGFYLISKVNALIGMPLVSLTFGYYKNWSEGSQFNWVSEWTILWPFYLWTIFSVVKNFVKNRIKFDNNQLYILLLYLGFFGLFIIIPFWVRYLMLIFPFMIIYFVSQVPQVSKKILLILFIIYSLQVSLYLYQPLRQNYLDGMAQSWERGTYQDLYNSINDSYKKVSSRQEFWRFYQKFDRDLGILGKTVLIKKLDKFWQYPQTVDIEINYQTPIAVYVDRYQTQFIKENGQWKMNWNYNPGYATSKYMNGSFGKFISEDGQIISEGEKRLFYSVTLSKIKDETQLQEQLLYLTGLKKYDVELKYKANNQSDWASNIDFLKNDLTIASVEAKILDPGIQVEIKETRVYNPSIYKNKKNFQFIEKKQSSLLSTLNPIVGGEIEIMLNNKIKYSFSKKPENGQDVILKGIQDLNKLTK